MLRLPLLLLSWSFAAGGCHETRTFETEVSIERVSPVRSDENSRPLTTDLEIKYLACPGEQREILRDLHGICRVFFRSLEVLKPCEYPDPPADRIVYSPERNYRAEVCVQIPVFDRSHFGWPADRRVSDILETVECLLRSLGARWKRWDEEAPPTTPAPEICEAKARKAADRSDEGTA